MSNGSPMQPMERRFRRIAAAGAIALAAVAFAAPSAADWLVTRDGARIETRGPWRVDGRKVLFDQPDGTLSVIRVDEVDLDRSAVATAEARAAAETPEPVVEPRKEPVLRLTEKDIPPSGEAAAEAEESAGAAAAATETSVGLEVISWEKTENAAGDGVDVFGTIRNNSENMVTTPTVLVAIYDADGGLLATNNGVINAPQIAAGKTANFRVSFAGLTDFASVKFDPQGRGFKQRPATTGGADEEEGEAIDIEFEPPPSDSESPAGF